jgi:hypothetical protein
MPIRRLFWDTLPSFRSTTLRDTETETFWRRRRQRRMRRWFRRPSFRRRNKIRDSESSKLRRRGRRSAHGR